MASISSTSFGAGFRRAVQSPRITSETLLRQSASPTCSRPLAPLTPQVQRRAISDQASSSSLMSRSIPSSSTTRACSIGSTGVRLSSLRGEPFQRRGLHSTHLRLSSRSVQPSAPKSASSSSTSTESESEPDPDHPPPKASLKDRLKFLTRRYGWWALGVYLGASAIDFGLTFAAIHMLGAEHIKKLENQVRESLGMAQRQDDEEDDAESSASASASRNDRNPNLHQPATAVKSKSKAKDTSIYTEVVLAYTIHKTLLLPFRVAFTAAVTPSFVKWLVKMGWTKANHQVRAQVAKKAAEKAAAKAATGS